MSDEESGFGFDLSGDDSDDGGQGGGLMGSCIAMLIGVILFPLSLYVLGWNEQHFVCQGNHILYAEAHVKEVGCNSKGVVDEFVFFSCPLVQSSLETFTPCSFNTQSMMDCTTQPPINFVSVSGRQVVEMYQCSESCETKKTKNAMGQNVKTKVCNYSPKWSDELIQSATFAHTPAEIGQACPGLVQAGANPAPPSNLDMGRSTSFATDVLAGDLNASFELNRDLITQLYPHNYVSLAPFAAEFGTSGGQQTVINNQQPWVRPLVVSSTNVMVSGNYLVTCQTPQIGCVRVSYFESNSTSPSVMTQVKSGGLTAKQEIPGSWGCPKESWQAILPEKLAKSDMVSGLQDLNYTRVWMIRIGGLLCCWFAIWACFQPISAAAEAAGDCINMCPCGGYIDDFLTGLVDSVICLLSCSFGCASGLFVIAIVWLFMRPLYGGLLLGACVLLCCCAGAVRSQSSKSRPLKGKGGGRRGGSAPVDPSLAQGFLEAARAEYVYGAPSAVESFFDGQGVEPEDQQALASYEDEIRNANDKHQAISQLQRRWGLGVDE